MGGAWGTYWVKRSVYRVLVGKPKGYNLEHLLVHGRIMLK
jgi:hypothetical protein